MNRNCLFTLFTLFTTFLLTLSCSRKPEKYYIYWTLEGIVDGSLTSHIETRPRSGNLFSVTYNYSFSQGGFLLKGQGITSDDTFDFIINLDNNLLNIPFFENKKWYTIEEQHPEINKDIGRLHSANHPECHFVSGRFAFIRNDDQSSQSSLIGYSLLFDCIMATHTLSNEPDTIHVTNGKVDIYQILAKYPSYTKYIRVSDKD